MNTSTAHNGSLPTIDQSKVIVFALWAFRLPSRSVIENWLDGMRG